MRKLASHHLATRRWPAGHEAEIQEYSGSVGGGARIGGKFHKTAGCGPHGQISSNSERSNAQNRAADQSPRASLEQLLLRPSLQAAAQNLREP